MSLNWNWRARIWPRGDVGLVVAMSSQKLQTWEAVKLGEQNDIPFGAAEGDLRMEMEATPRNVQKR